MSDPGNVDEQLRPHVGGGAAHQDVDTRQDPVCLCRNSCGGDRIRCVADDKVCGSTEFGDRLRGQLTAFGVATGDHDPRYARRRQRPGRGQPDAGRAAHD